MFHGGVVAPSQMKRLRNSGGEIVEVNGGHIVRSINRKDRHSKVCTSKGPRDRRLRLSANTAIQFYDVQDRLGYDRPSNAVDWLIKKAKSAIDELEELPPWKPTTGISNSSSRLNFEDNPDEEITNNEMGNDQNSIFLPQSLDSIKSFFPMGCSSTPVNGDSPAMQLHRSFLPPENLRLRLAGDHGGLGWPESVDSVSGGSEFSSQATQTTPFQQMLFSPITNNNHFFNDSNFQRGPLQSSKTPSIRAWNDQPPFTGAAIDHSGFPSGIGGFSGFFYPAQIQDEQEENDGLSDKPSSVSSDSRQ